MNNKLILFVLAFILLGGIIVVNPFEKKADSNFDVCENAKSFTPYYNKQFYSKESAEFYDKIKIDILGECGYLNG